MKYLIGITIAMFLLTVSFTNAQRELTMDLIDRELIINPGEEAIFMLTAYSPETEGGLYVYVEGTPSHWINLGTSYIDLPIEEPIFIPLDFFPNNVPGTYKYTVFVQSMLKPDVKVSREVTLIVLGGEDVRGLDSEIIMDDESINIQLEIDSIVEEEITAEFSLISSSGMKMATYTRTFIVEGKSFIKHEIPLSAAVFADTYTVRAEIKDTGMVFEEMFEIEPIHRIVKTSEESSSTLFQEYRLSVANEGNVVEEDYVVTANVPTGFLTFSVEPDRCEAGVCEWSVSKLNPGEALQIVYRLEYWPLVAQGVLIAVILALFVFFGWNRINVPSFRKNIEVSKDGKYTAVLEIKNAGKKITNVVVRDEVSALFKLIRKFDTVEPAIKHHEDTTELVWSLPAIEPGDQRIIHYSMAPVVKGHLKVPKAHMRYSTESGKKSKVESKGSYLAA
ncbi:MAG: DUF11 domain-containing protein [Candidatus Aenigmatarchaeota archaeon]|nr:MAG: DUF11 domain-containing protein [Candidatus Aenigmarchaeota archaeon]